MFLYMKQGQTVNGLKQAILENNYILPDHLSGPCIDLIRAILKRDPAERITMAGIRGSEWLHGQVRLQTLPTYQFIPSGPGEEVQLRHGWHNYLTHYVTLILWWQKTQMEVKVLARLDELGISESMVMEHREKGGRSAIMGTYRILMYRASCDEEEVANMEKSTEENHKQENQLLVPTNHSLAGSIAKSIKSRTSSAKSSRSNSPKPNSSSSPLTFNATPPSMAKHQTQQSPLASPGKAKFKHKLNLSILKNKQSSSTPSPSDKKSAKKKKGSQACTIL